MAKISDMPAGDRQAASNTGGVATDERPVGIEQAPQETGRGAALRQFRPAIILTLLLTVILGIIYPLVTTGVAQVAFPSQANGSIVYVNGKAVGSSLIGQYWTQPQYFHGRPSATVNAQGQPAPYARQVSPR